MEETEVPLENVQEQTIHHAAHATEDWVLWVATSSAIFAVLAAIAALMSGYHANEAVIDQLRASDGWAQYQAKSIKSSIVMIKGDILTATGHAPADSDKEKIARYREEMDEISKESKEKEAASLTHLHHHEIYAKSVTLMQVAIATAAIAVVTKRRRFWWVGLLLGLGGALFLAQALLTP